MNQERHVFAYWVGKKPALIEILHELMRLHSSNGDNFRLHLLTGEEFLRDYSDVPECFDLLHPAHQADVVRVWALHRHGGIWLDSDTLVMNSLSSLFENALDNKAGFFMTQNNQCLSNGVFGSKRKTSLMSAWKEHIQKHLQVHGPNIRWEGIGNKFLTETFNTKRKLFDGYIIYNGPNTMYPANWDKCVELFIDKPYWTHKHLIREYQPLIVLVNSVYKAMAPYSKSQILESEYPLNYFINTSLRSLVI
jgi:hypothetical protein